MCQGLSCREWDLNTPLYMAESLGPYLLKDNHQPDCVVFLHSIANGNVFIITCFSVVSGRLTNPVNKSTRSYDVWSFSTNRILSILLVHSVKDGVHWWTMPQNQFTKSRKAYLDKGRSNCSINQMSFKIVNWKKKGNCIIWKCNLFVLCYWFCW